VKRETGAALLGNSQNISEIPQWNFFEMENYGNSQWSQSLWHCGKYFKVIRNFRCKQTV